MTLSSISWVLIRRSLHEPSALGQRAVGDAQALVQPHERAVRVHRAVPVHRRGGRAPVLGRSGFRAVPGGLRGVALRGRGGRGARAPAGELARELEAEEHLREGKCRQQVNRDGSARGGACTDEGRRRTTSVEKGRLDQRILMHRTPRAVSHSVGHRREREAENETTKETRLSTFERLRRTFWPRVENGRFRDPGKEEQMDREEVRRMPHVGWCSREATACRAWGSGHG